MKMILCRMKSNYCFFKYFLLFLKILSAAITAETRLSSLALFLPAISKAVPWSGEVLTNLNAAVKFTPLFPAIILNGINPWS